MHADESDESSSEDTSMSEGHNETTWVEWFCSLKGNEFFVQVDEDYIQDDFNLVGLSQLVPYYEPALSILLDEDDQDNMPDSDQEVLETACQMLYGLIHARFILTSRGIQALYEKYSEGVYGNCWNEACRSEDKFVLPIGRDVVGEGGTDIFCPHCGERYVPRSAKLAQLDGAYFGSSAAHILVLQYISTINPGTTAPFIPSLYGFRISPNVRDEMKKRKAAIKSQVG